MNDNNTLAGWVDGNATGGKRVMGTLAGSWTKDGGFTSLQIGGGGTTEKVAILASGRCATGKENQQGERD